VIEDEADILEMPPKIDEPEQIFSLATGKIKNDKKEASCCATDQGMDGL
jgi:hypothetical protein